jgi:hypothetical protein
VVASGLDRRSKGPAIQKHDNGFVPWPASHVPNADAARLPPVGIAKHIAVRLLAVQPAERGAQSARHRRCLCPRH